MALETKAPAMHAHGPGRGSRHANAADEPTLARESGRSQTVVRIIARRVPWPSPRVRSDRSGLRLRWDALTEAGELLASATEHPFADGAYVLAGRGVDLETLVTMRHEGSPHDSFKPMPLRVVAEKGAQRAAARERMAARRLVLREEMPATTGVEPFTIPDHNGRLRTVFEAEEGCGHSEPGNPLASTTELGEEISPLSGKA